MPLANEVLAILLDETGDGTGNHHANVDGSGAPVVFKSICPAGQQYHVYALHIHIADDDVIKPETYGGVASLTNGIDLQVLDTDDSVIYNIFNGHTIKHNNDFAGMGELATLDIGAGATYGVAVYVDFAKAYGGPLIMTTGQAFALTVNDNLSGLTDHHFFIQGHKVTHG